MAACFCKQCSLESKHSVSRMCGVCRYIVSHFPDPRTVEILSGGKSQRWWPSVQTYCLVLSCFVSEPNHTVIDKHRMDWRRPAAPWVGCSSWVAAGATVSSGSYSSRYLCERTISDPGKGSCAIICVKREEEWGENTTLRGASAVYKVCLQKRQNCFKVVFEKHIFNTLKAIYKL